jgi:hypothetical protein
MVPGCRLQLPAVGTFQKTRRLGKFDFAIATIFVFDRPQRMLTNPMSAETARKNHTMTLQIWEKRLETVGSAGKLPIMRENPKRCWIAVSI